MLTDVGPLSLPQPRRRAPGHFSRWCEICILSSPASLEAAVLTGRSEERQASLDKRRPVRNPTFIEVHSGGHNVPRYTAVLRVTARKMGMRPLVVRPPATPVLHEKIIRARNLLQH